MRVCGIEFQAHAVAQQYLALLADRSAIVRGQAGQPTRGADAHHHQRRRRRYCAAEEGSPAKMARGLRLFNRCAHLPP